MISTKIKTLSPIGHSPYQDGFVGTEIISRIGLGQFVVNVPLNRHQVENGGGEILDYASVLVCHVADHGKRLEINLRSHDGRPEVQHDAALQLLHGFGEDQEVMVAGGAQRLAVAVR